MKRRRGRKVRVEKNGCWTWLMGKSTAGYGYCGDGKGGKQLAHRMTWEMDRGPIPAGLVLDHLCRNPACVNPAHLEPVTHAENCRRGAKAKLTADDARAIRESEDRTGLLVKRYGVSSHQILAIRKGLAWA